MVKSVMQLIEEARALVNCAPLAEAVARYLATPGALLLDVREPPEMAGGMAAGALAMPRGIVEMEILKVTTDAETPIFVHCGNGPRAILAARTLQEMGYSNVTAIVGPFAELAAELESRRGA